jgi:5-methyltetrahydrofolate--homocysteine methyltransferase
MINLNEISQSIKEGEVSAAVAKTKAALGENIAAKDILDNGLVPGIEEVGNLFAKGELYFPELIMAGEAMKATLELLNPELSKKKVPSIGKFLIGTVKDDMHDIGKNIVVMFLQANGWEVTDLGTDLPPERFCEEVQKGNFDIIGLSALLTITMPYMGQTIDALKEAGLRDKVKVMIGGVSVTQDYTDKIGADAYGKDVVDTVRKAKQLIGKS